MSLPELPDLSDGDRHLQRLQRMATLGTLASGLGHDLRNLVMPVLLRLDVVAATPDLPEKARADLASIKQSILRLQRLAGGLRLLASDPFNQRDEVQLTVLPDWWHEMQPIVVDALPSHTVVDVELTNDLPMVEVPPGALAHVLINLVMNSRHAMENVPVPRVTLRARTDEDRVVISLADNGSGMDEETRRRAFEPYFTTRTREYATGLGLSTGRALLNRYGGDLSVATTDGSGTTVVMTVPARRIERSGDSRSAQRIRLMVNDPRQRAVLRLLIRHRGLAEWTGTEPDHADVTICDAELLPVLLDGSNGSTTSAATAGRIIALGEPRPAYATAVRWMDPHDLSVLDDVLQ